MATIAQPQIAPARAPSSQDAIELEPLYNVVLLDDDDHTYQYVIYMLCKLFGHGPELAYLMACAVDKDGRVIVHTAAQDDARRKRDAIKAFGPDPLLPQSSGSMHAVIEPIVS